MCHRGPEEAGWTAWGAASSGREQQLTTRAHVTVETPAIQLDGNCWKFLHGTSQGAAIAPATAAPSAGGPGPSGGPPRRPGVGGHVPQPRAAASRPGRGALAAAMLTAKSTAHSWRGCRGPHARSGRHPGTEALEVPTKGEPWAPCRTGTQVSHVPWPPKGSQSHALLSPASATELKTKRPPAGSL